MALNPRPSIPGNSPGTSIPRMEIALISENVGTNPIVISEWLLVLDQVFLVTNQAPPFQEWQQPLYLIM